MHWFTPTEASPPTPAVVPSGEAALPTESQPIIAPLTPDPATKSVEAPVAPAPAVRAPQVPAPVVQPRAASVKPDSRRNPTDKTQYNGRPGQSRTKDGAAGADQAGGNDGATGAPDEAGGKDGRANRPGRSVTTPRTRRNLPPRMIKRRWQNKQTGLVTRRGIAASRACSDAFPMVAPTSYARRCGRIAAASTSPWRSGNSRPSSSAIRPGRRLPVRPASSTSTTGCEGIRPDGRGVERPGRLPRCRLHSGRTVGHTASPITLH